MPFCFGVHFKIFSLYNCACPSSLYLVRVVWVNHFEGQMSMIIMLNIESTYPSKKCNSLYSEQDNVKEEEQQQQNRGLGVGGWGGDKMWQLGRKKKKTIKFICLQVCGKELCAHNAHICKAGHSYIHKEQRVVNIENIMAFCWVFTRRSLRLPFFLVDWA